MCPCPDARCRLEVDDERHGTPNAYRNLFCRCTACCAANTVWCADVKARRLARPIPPRVHGTPNGYGNYDCRCTDCGDAWYEYRATG